eukprot:TRINITY_DN11759_c0_g1_i1.p1 TRINITY_DN11759_c0_g1~~TRINITY_DN11759_c0_g1_i1.p1  ORF type:complete len:423 (-),score=57.13 TRINITY_DN11759_c0_g1_i1:301-1569(-)
MAVSSGPRLMIVSDLDNTMVDHHDDQNVSLLRFNALWQADYNFDCTLVFSTGRSPTLYQELRKEKPLATPHIAIMSVGTEIMYGDTMTPDCDWERELNEGWDRNVVVEEAMRFPKLVFQADTEQRPHKVSFSCTKADAQDVIAALSERLGARGLDVKLIYSGGTDLDVLPQGAGKGQALAYLLRKLKSQGGTPRITLVCGDSGNDAELFSVADVHGVIVGNAQEELLQWHAENAKDNAKVFLATERCAAGILQALKHFQVEPNVSPRDISLLSNPFHLEPGSPAAPAHTIVEKLVVHEQYLRGEIENSQLVSNFLTSVQANSAEMVSGQGLRYSGEDALKKLTSSYGCFIGTNYRMWVDRLRATQLGDKAWVVTFDRWQRNGTELSCLVSTAVLQAKAGARYGIEVIKVHETLVSSIAATCH